MPRALLLFAFVTWAAAFPATAQTAIGTAERVQGPVTGTVGGATSPLAAGDPLALGEVVAAGANARAALRFADGTALTIGENASVTLDAFVYDPDGASTFAANVTGAFRYISGKLGEGATREARVTTPQATIGVRGTDFWGGPIDGRYGIVVLEGSVTVTPPGGAPVILDAVGMGVDIDAGVAAAPVIWAEARRQRAVAAVSFE